MIPREAERGASFKGAGLYYLHDKQADTAERVAFTHTENLPTRDPEKALKWMAWTAMHSEELKERAGESRKGRKSEKPVYAFSLAWQPDEKPEQWEMIVAARQALEKLGLRDHESLMVGHDDREHPHLHVIVNLVHPETGRSNTLKNSRKKLSLWAEEYEHQRGHIYCEQRVENNRKRKEGREVRYQEKPLDIKAEITRAYFAADSGKAFRAALEEKGLRLANARRLVIIDQQGNIYSLSRNVEGAKAADIKAKLRDLEIPALDEARGEDGRKTKRQRADREFPDRDRQDRDWQEKIISAGIRAEKDKADAGLKNRRQDKHLFEWGTFYEESHRSRQSLEFTLDRQYGANERQLKRDIAEIDGALNGRGRVRVWWMKLTGQVGFTAERDLENMRATLATIEQRKAEAQAALENEIAVKRAALDERQAWEKGLKNDLRPERVDELSRSIDNREDSYEARRTAFLSSSTESEVESTEDDPLAPTSLDPLAVSIRQQQFAQAAAYRGETADPSAPAVNIPSPPAPTDADYEARRAAWMGDGVVERERTIEPER